MEVDLSELSYYQGLALLKLGQKEKTTKIFDEIINYGKKQLKMGTTMDFFAKFGEKQLEQARKAHNHYLLGLGYLGKGQPAHAKIEFEKALKLNPYHAWAKVQLSY